MRKTHLRPAAQRDVDVIWDFSADEWGLDQADAYVLDIQNAINLIAINPLIGSDSSAWSDGLRKFSVGSHAISSVFCINGWTPQAGYNAL
jgi:toxin ParE1/3/4